MPIADTKKVQSFIQAFLPEIAKIESADTALQALKTEWLAQAPSLTDSNMGIAEAAAANNFLAAVNTLLSDHSAIIATLKAKDMPSHGTKSLLGS